MKQNQEVIIERYNPSFNFGLNDEQVRNRIDNKLTNKVIKKTGKSYLRIVIDNVLTLFNLLYVVIFFLMISAQQYMVNKGEEVSTSILKYTFIIIVTINLLIGLIQEIKSKKIISKLQLISAPHVTVIRNGEERVVKVEEVVIDDIVKLVSGNEITTDSILVSGDVEVNESQLTGESVAIQKKVGDMLYSGSYVVSGTCYCKVERVGADNQIEKLSAEAKVYKKPNSQILTSLRRMIKIITAFLLITGILMVAEGYNFEEFQDATSGIGRFLYQDLYLGFLHKVFPQASSNWYNIITSTCTALLGMIPAGLLMMTSAALVLGVIRLSGHQTLVQDIYCVEMLARVDVLCLDKTGTITDGSMTVINFEDLQKNKYDIKLVMARLNGALNETNATAKALEKYFGRDESVSYKDIIPFSSDRKYSGVVYEDETYIIGAPEFVLKNGYEKYASLVNKKANEGYRVLCLAVTNQDLLEKKMTRSPKAIALIYIEDQIRPEAEATIRYFRENGVEVKVISGDNPVTVSEVAKRVGIANAENYQSLDGLSDDEVYAIATKCTVFGRVKPHQKQIIVKALKDHKKTVAMTGDGVNDILALKEADCSIAMASGSDAVRSVAQLVLLDSNFASMPKVVDEGRRAINNVQKISMLYLVKTFFMISLAVLTVIGFFKRTSGDSTFPFSTTTQLLMLEVFVIGIPSVFLTIQPNTDRVSGNFLWNVLQKSLPGVVAIVLAVIITYLLSSMCGFEIKTVKTIVVLSATFIGLMILYLACKPFNKKRTVMFFVMLVLCLFVTIESMTRRPHIRLGSFVLGDYLAESLDLDNLLDHRSVEQSGETIEAFYNTSSYLINYTNSYENISEDTKLRLDSRVRDAYLYTSEIMTNLSTSSTYHIATIESYLEDLNRIFSDEKVILELDKLIEVLDTEKEEASDTTDIENDIANLNIIHNYYGDHDTINNLIVELKKVDSNSKYNLTAMLLAFSLVAMSFIIMSVTSYIIDLINKWALVKNINALKNRKSSDEDDVSEFIDHNMEE